MCCSLTQVTSFEIFFWQSDSSIGPLGTYTTAIYLANKGHTFIMSVKAETFPSLFKYIEKDLQVWYWDIASNDKMCAIAWKINTHKERTVRWFTNLEDMDNACAVTDTFFIKVSCSFLLTIL
jgi:hypothetical protein